VLSKLGLGLGNLRFETCIYAGTYQTNSYYLKPVAAREIHRTVPNLLW
jgi:hypothetical protein